jgi:ribosomal biogenesis protein LAS1
LALLAVIQQDRNQENATSGFSLNYLSLRHSYASAIIRLVNGLVDPLQLGAYARPIASIASQLGLPSWLVELRHAATHEDLPSLEILREAARQVSIFPSLVDFLQMEKLSRWHGFSKITSFQR